MRNIKVVNKTSQAAQKQYAKTIYLHLCCGCETWFFALKGKTQTKGIWKQTDENFYFGKGQ